MMKTKSLETLQRLIKNGSSYLVKTIKKCKYHKNRTKPNE